MFIGLDDGTDSGDSSMVSGDVLTAGLVTGEMGISTLNFSDVGYGIVYGPKRMYR
jgi:hypothetical protein